MMEVLRLYENYAQHIFARSSRTAPFAPCLAFHVSLGLHLHLHLCLRLCICVRPIRVNSPTCIWPPRRIRIRSQGIRPNLPRRWRRILIILKGAGN
jgi:hypothetical protein